MMKWVLMLFLGNVFVSQAATVNTSLYILRDSIHFDNGTALPYTTFNANNTFNATNARIVVNQGDQLDLWVVNFDSDPHEFRIQGETTTVTIPVGDSVQVLYDCNTPGVYIFHDPMNFPDNASAGLSGMLVVKNTSHAGFYWNVKEHQVGYNDSVFAGTSPNWMTYYPEHFTINGRSNPNINNDPDARVVGNVGDTIYIYIANTGQSVHSMHLHGYHATVTYYSKDASKVGWSKDSMPIYPSETMILELVPDIPGEYPVHDHNLIGTTGGSLYPQGMFTTLLIAP
ncbi:MAG: multicopper oxidase domain-containing protein [bacterium]|nr:multicopper oxidase domain-containing protein [bacterium]